MSFFPGKDPAAGDRYACDALETVVVPRSVDLGDGFAVRRALPHTSRRTVGPFVFFDHFGPAEFKSGHGLDVRPHPHIGLSTLTYLYDGEIIHRDNTGVKAAIHPGAVNWMTAGRGIVHSERTAPDHRATGNRSMASSSGSGCRQKEEIDPTFAHLDGADCRSSPERARPRESSREPCSASVRRSRPYPRPCSPMSRSKRQHGCRSMRTARNAEFMSWR
jgi:redox-sensitive bicupin YhaK (pirin superfamily)